ncbi:MAG: D-alanyl-D-alanine carboxypeptidase [Alphaproteobacteria bacterium]|nr:D-alanyl-D-alanine carboxypeptidase [Alphaproteobacteria bacterium]
MMFNRIVAIVLMVLFFAVPAQAQSVAPPESAARHAILIEAQTGTVLFAKEADAHMPTSSMSKIMTMYLVFEAIKDGKIKVDETLPVSKYAWQQQGSRMFVNVGERVKVEDLIRGVVVQSGNDASVVFAEALGGSEANFAEMMNAKAKELGMENSHFKNATGLPDPDHYSTARDLATLTLALQRDFPQEYRYFSELEFTYNKIKQGNRNPILYRNVGADGVKTGHTETAGYGLVASSVRDGRRLVLVVNGLEDMQARADEAALLLDWGYREFGLYSVVKAGDKLAETKVWLGEQKTVPLVAGKNLIISLPRSAKSELKTSVTYDQKVNAPVAKDQVIGKITVTAPGLSAAEVSLVAGADVKQLGFFQRIWAKLLLSIGKEP